jgi:hypothetical protein
LINAFKTGSCICCFVPIIATKQQNNKTTKQQNNKTTKQQSNKTTKAIKKNPLKRLLVSSYDLFSLDSITNSYRYG